MCIRDRQNIGKMRNRGIELSLNAQLINHKNFKWNFFANFARNKTKILELGQGGACLLYTSIRPFISEPNPEG